LALDSAGRSRLVAQWSVLVQPVTPSHREVQEKSEEDDWGEGQSWALHDLIGGGDKRHKSSKA